MSDGFEKVGFTYGFKNVGFKIIGSLKKLYRNDKITHYVSAVAEVWAQIRGIPIYISHV